ncbi:hypothetical protein BD779DRAFT_1613954 [Infundibulicybe gibba]|nr:hypothetical protein BD779DRAFT_1613954 [Infundibulicybe gibba]
MCINSCHAFTGPFAQLDACSICHEPRYDPVQLAKSRKKVPRKHCCTIPLGLQIQALRRSRQGAEAMRYRDRKTQEIFDSLENAALSADVVYDDIFCGADFLDLANCINLTSDDTTVAFSLDSAQLYQNKKSDTWIAIWIVLDYDPTTRYKKKHILPAMVVPGPKKPKHLDSFLFRSFHHLSAIQRENNNRGMLVWDALKNSVLKSQLNGRVCWQWRRQMGGIRYY